ncbi:MULTISPECIES: hypothetical protein [Dickeya]|uniref:Uncharacterized protein n=1 Tax=Dickeya aquatica TaxID=1401087 RepID=A0A375AA37_9GAMM|nr:MULTISPECIES: hypothetical protein [Dickeya]SLM62801.1 hypothetical protein DAQ1742_01864 [Dickeya aquatica]
MKIGSSSAGKFKGSRPQFEVKPIIKNGITYYYIFHKGTDKLREPVKEYSEAELDIAMEDCRQLNIGLDIR